MASVDICLPCIISKNLNKTTEEAEKEYSSLNINKAMKLTTRIAEETIQKGRTLWGLFSGVTSYTNRDVRNKRNDILESKMVGSGYKIDNKAYDYVEAWV